MKSLAPFYRSDTWYIQNETPPSLLLRSSKTISLEHARVVAASMNAEEAQKLRDYIARFSTHPFELEHRLCQEFDCATDLRYEVFHNLGQALSILFEWDYETGKEAGFALVENLGSEREASHYAGLLQMLGFRLLGNQEDFEAFVRLLTERSFQMGLFLYGPSLIIWEKILQAGYFSEEPQFLIDYLRTAISHWKQRAEEPDASVLSKFSAINMARKFAQTATRFSRTHAMARDVREFSSEIRQLEQALRRLPRDQVSSEFEALLRRNTTSTSPYSVSHTLLP